MADQPRLFADAPADAVDRGAILSADGVYRYRLSRVWHQALPLVAPALRLVPAPEVTRG